MTNPTPSQPDTTHSDSHHSDTTLPMRALEPNPAAPPPAPRNALGVLLLALGALALLGNLGVPGLLGAALLALLGAYLFRRYRSDTRQLWALVASFALFGLALAAMSGPLAGSYFLLMLAAGFALAFRQDARRWWALIPAGILTTLAAVAGLNALMPRLDEGPLFFLGLAATFGVVYRQRQRWAIYPALGALALALLAGSFTGGWLLPLALLGAGIYLLGRDRSPRAAPTSAQPPVTPDPSQSVRSPQPGSAPERA